MPVQPHHYFDIGSAVARTSAVVRITFLSILALLTACDRSGDDNAAVDGSPVVLTPDAVGAARFLTQASFGPTEAGIDELQASDLNSWIDTQISLPVSETLPYVKANSNGSNREARHDIWWRNAILGEDQLRQRVAFALSQIFVISDIDYVLANNQYSISSYYDMLSHNAFGNYRELLEKVTLHPAMGIYLGMVRNEKANPALNIRPDENYAREVLQLFSIGLVELDAAGQPVPADNPLPSYTQSTVQEFARVFTGWNYPDAETWTSLESGNPLETPMQAVEEYHDTESKTLLNGQVLPAGLSAREDLEAALDNIFAHPNVAPFVSTLLIKRLVTSNPTAAYIQRVAGVFADNGAGIRGDLAAVIKAILLDPEARNGHSTLASFGKLKEPVIRTLQYFRALDATPGETASGQFRSATFPAFRIDELLGQSVLRSTSVFNFFQPDHPVSDYSVDNAGRVLVSPEAQILTQANVAGTSNDTHSAVYQHHNLSDASASASRINLDRPLALVKQSPEKLLDLLDLVLLAGSMTQDFRQALLDHMAALAGTTDTVSDTATQMEETPVDDATALQQVLDTVFMILASPQYMVQR